MKKAIPVIISIIVLAAVGVASYYWEKEEAVEAPLGGSSVISRTYTSDTIDNGDGTYTLNAHGGHINYKDDSGNLVPVDYTMTDKGTYWEMTKASYKFYVRKDFGAANLIRFDNKYEGANHTIIYEPKMLAWVNNPDLSDMVVIAEEQSVNGVYDAEKNTIYYTSAFGEGFDFEITLLSSGFKKEIVILAKSYIPAPPTADHKLVAFFRYTGDGLTVKGNTDTDDWDNDGYYTDNSDDGFTVRQADGKRSFIQPAYIKDSSEEKDSRLIKVFWKKHNGKLWQAKVLPKAFLLNATYPVRADTTTNYATTNCSGTVNRATSAAWSTIYDGAGEAKTTLPDGVAFPYLRSNANPNQFDLIRRWEQVFDTTALPAGVTVSSSTVYFYSIGAGLDTYGTCAFNLYSSNPASNTELTIADYTYTNWGTTPYSDNLTAAQWPALNNPYAFRLNAAGKAAVAKAGYTKFSIREVNHEAADTPPTWSDGKLCYIQVYTAGTAGKEPYISVEYSLVSASAVPTSVCQDNAHITTPGCPQGKRIKQRLNIQ